ncbi:MAG: hypothetical protein JW719_08380, partial [Pirellulales bacterium]|nr:hypothetical protein [Pirellulales bacterium]
MDTRRMLAHFYLTIILLAVAPTTLPGQVAAPRESAKDSARRKDTKKEHLLGVSFDISGLPVWIIDEAGNTHFDASVVISRIKSQVEPNIWRSGKAKLIQSTKNKSLVVLAPVSDAHELIDKVSALLGRMKAFAEHNVGVRLSDNLEIATIANQQVLIFCSDPDSTLADQFFAARSENSRLRQILRNNYILQCVQPKKAKELAENGVVAPSETGAAFTIVNIDGKAIADKRFESLSDNGLAQLTEFLERHTKELPDAKQLLEAALAKAKTEDKRVLVQMSGPACGQCILLTRYLNSQKDIVAK